MSDRPRPGRCGAGRRGSTFDSVTLAALVVASLVTAAVVIHLGTAEAGNRLGCGLNGLVNSLLPYPRPCR